MDFLMFEKDEAVVITGAGGGIGRATAMLAASAGLTVHAWDYDEPSAEATVAEIVAAGGRATGLRIDVTDRPAVAAAFEAVGPVRYLVNNAGPASTSGSGFADGVTATLGSVETVTSSWLRLAPEDIASVVSTASVSGASVSNAAAWYDASKAGIAAYMRNLAVHRPRGVRANTVAPGLVATARTRPLRESADGAALIARSPMRRAARPDEVGAATIFLLSPRAGFINGVTLFVDGASSLVY
jgi:NAD(P)-dependent dehydrogenase (short-subunit alcohol dehydrogenase family)